MTGSPPGSGPGLARTPIVSYANVYGMVKVKLEENVAGERIGNKGSGRLPEAYSPIGKIRFAHGCDPTIKETRDGELGAL